MVTLLKYLYEVTLYSRNFIEPPKAIVENGKAHFGTYDGVPAKIDIRGMRAPYAGIPLPSFISNLRIKSRLDYVFSLDKYIGFAEFFDFKVFGIAQIIFWNKETGKKNVYHSLMATRRRFVPVLTTRGICASYKKSRYIKISWGRKHQHHALTFKVKGDSVRPDAEGYFYSPMQDDMHRDVTFVNPSPTSSRCSATWITPMNIQGHIAINKEQADDSKGLAAMILNRTYFKMHSKTTFCMGIGSLKGKNLIFHLKCSNLDAADAEKNNDNILFVDGDATTLPSVYITHSFGMAKDWVIQDTENMIDLTFTPVSLSSKTLNIIALRTSTTAIYGTFSGVLITKNAEKLVLKGFPGIIDTNLIRI